MGYTGVARRDLPSGISRAAESDSGGDSNHTCATGFPSRCTRDGHDSVSALVTNGSPERPDRIQFSGADAAGHIEGLRVVLVLASLTLATTLSWAQSPDARPSARADAPTPGSLPGRGLA